MTNKFPIFLSLVMLAGCGGEHIVQTAINYGGIAVAAVDEAAADELAERFEDCLEEPNEAARLAACEKPLAFEAGMVSLAAGLFTLEALWDAGGALFDSRWEEALRTVIERGRVIWGFAGDLGLEEIPELQIFLSAIGALIE